MQINALCSNHVIKKTLAKTWVTRTLLVMQFTGIILFVFLLQVSAASVSQTVTYSGKSVALPKVFHSIEKQTGYVFFYDKDDINIFEPVTVSFKKVQVIYALQEIFKDQLFSYEIHGNTVFIKKKPRAPVLTGGNKVSPESPPITVRGRILNENNEPVIASVIIKGTNRGTTSHVDGAFELTDTEENAVLVITAANIQRVEWPVNGKSFVTIIVKTAVNPLDEVVFKGYYGTSKRLNTGNVSVVKASDIEKQPVSNPLAALQGRVPGLEISNTNGVPGSTIRVQIRGTNSLSNGSEPLFIIDGVPFAPGNQKINQDNSIASWSSPRTVITASAGRVGSSTLNASSGLSPFNMLNPADIESVEVLKDADATAIYGSRGANGVVLITTKSGKAGKTKLDVNIYTGVSRVTRLWDMLNTSEYLAMRWEAFKNDSVSPTISNAYDLMVWDTTRYTDWQKMIIGNTANVTDASASLSGGTGIVQFFIGTGYRHETTVYPTDRGLNRGSLNAQIKYTSLNKKFGAALQLNYTSSSNKLTGRMPGIQLPPNAPSIYDSTGKLNWGTPDAPFDNPFSYLLKEYEMKLDNLLANFQLSYNVTKGLQLRANLGHNVVNADEESVSPDAANDPSWGTGNGSSIFSYGKLRNWIIEPVAEYKWQQGKSRITALAGSTLQSNNNVSSQISAYGFSTDALIRVLSAATEHRITNTSSKYKYAALFARLNYQWNEQYIVNLTGRRDGSSRFGEGRKYNNFGALGAAWIFSDAAFAKNWQWLSFGKLRASYGVTGNDQIGDYKYLNTWTPGQVAYGGQQTLLPDGLFNDQYSWERTTKVEAALELGFWNNRILSSIAYYRNRSDNQLVQYQLPVQTGFPGIMRNFPALIENSGFEWEFSADVVQSNTFNWNMAFNVTVPSNTLISFPNLASSSYASYYEVGKSVNLIRGYHVVGVNPATGIYEFEDVDKNGSIGSKDRKGFGKIDPDFFGGWRSRFDYKGLQLDIFMEFKKQFGYTKYYSLNYAGNMNNRISSVLERWKQPGDVTRVQQLTATYTAANRAAENFQGSDMAYGNTSYVRLKNLALSYDLPARWMTRVHVDRFRIYIHAQNVLTFSKDKDTDPEMTINSLGIPPLKTFTAGIQFSL